MTSIIRNLSIRKKFIIIIIAVMVTSSACIVLVHRYILYGNYVDLELQSAEKNLNRVTMALERELNQLNNICIDWASWDDAYAFVRTRDIGFIKKNLGAEAFKTGIFDFFCIIDKENRIMFIKRISHEAASKESPISDTDEKSRNRIIYFFKNRPVTTESITGSVSTRFGILLLSANPILTSKGEGNIAGYVIMGKYLTESALSDIKKQTGVDFDLINLSDSRNLMEYSFQIKHMSDGAINEIFISEKEFITAISMNNNVYGNPAYLIKSKFKRNLSEQGSAVINTSLLVIFSCLILLIIIIWFLIKNLIIKPVDQLEYQVKSIEDDRYSSSMIITGDDELGHLSKAIDTMAATITSKNRELIEVNRHLELISITDGLTGLYNRRHFDERIKNEWERGLRSGETLSVIMCDVDFFKKYNDIYGHQAGDECLKRVAIALKGSVHRSIDEIYRYGGEEFIILLPNTSTSGVVCIAEELLNSVFNMKIAHSGSPDYGFVTVSLGAASMIPKTMESFTGLVSHADAALYESKKRGRNRIHMAKITGHGEISFTG